MEPRVDIGLIGLAVMGQNLVLNMNDHGFTVAVYNRTTSKVDDFINGNARGTDATPWRVIGTHSIEDLVSHLKRPRRVMLMVKAGKAVDLIIAQLIPHLEEGDIIIDGGNSLYTDSIRRTEYLESQGLLFVGSGVSGGEEGARRGPSLMPGGSPQAWPHVKHILQSIAAKVADGTPCCDWVGENGAGHFVKMVHNGIEYGDLQLICEAYHLMDSALGTNTEEMSQVFAEWNKGCIIRAAFLDKIKQAFDQNPDLTNLLLDPYFRAQVESAQTAWRRIVAQAATMGIPVPAMYSALAFYDGYRHERLPANLLQAQRDYFGAHTYERVDRSRDEFFHTNWTGQRGNVTSGSYQA